jgi:hypothetical protein
MEIVPSKPKYVRISFKLNHQPIKVALFYIDNSFHIDYYQNIITKEVIKWHARP